MLEVLRNLNARLVTHGQARDIKDVISKALLQVGAFSGDEIRTTVGFEGDYSQSESPANTAAQFVVEFIRVSGILIVRRIIKKDQ